MSTPYARATMSTPAVPREIPFTFTPPSMNPSAPMMKMMKMIESDEEQTPAK